MDYYRGSKQAFVHIHGVVPLVITYDPEAYNQFVDLIEEARMIDESIVDAVDAEEANNPAKRMAKFKQRDKSVQEFYEK